MLFLFFSMCLFLLSKTHVESEAANCSLIQKSTFKRDFNPANVYPNTLLISNLKWCCYFSCRAIIKDATLCFTLLQAFVENGIPESPETTVALMRKVWTIRKFCFLLHCFFSSCWVLHDNSQVCLTNYAVFLILRQQ